MKTIVNNIGNCVVWPWPPTIVQNHSRSLIHLSTIPMSYIQIHNLLILTGQKQTSFLKSSSNNLLWKVTWGLMTYATRKLQWDMAKHRLLVKNAENDHIIKAQDDLNTFSVGLNGHPITHYKDYHPWWAFWHQYVWINSMLGNVEVISAILVGPYYRQMGLK